MKSIVRELTFWNCVCALQYEGTCLRVPTGEWAQTNQQLKAWRSLSMHVNMCLHVRQRGNCLRFWLACTFPISYGLLLYSLGRFFMLCTIGWSDLAVEIWMGKLCRKCSKGGRNTNPWTCSVQRIHCHEHFATM